MRTKAVPDAAAVISGVPGAPREASRRARRLVFSYGGSQGIILWIGMAFLGIGLAVTLPLGWGMPVDLAIAVSHRDVRGNVRSTRLQTHVRINHQHPTSIEYAYSVDGVEYEGSSGTLDYDLLERASIERKVVVQVAALNPSWSRIKGTSHALMGYWPLFAAIFPLIGGAMVWWAVRSNRREKWAFINGTPIMADVTFQGYDMTCSSNNRHPYMVKWEFRVEGELYEGSVSSMNESLLGDLMTVTRIPVLYDPLDPRINTVYVE